MEEKKILTPDEFAEEMDAIYRMRYLAQDDEELCHGDMDDLICNLLCALGYEKGINIFKHTPKWYS